MSEATTELGFSYELGINVRKIGTTEWTPLSFISAVDPDNAKTFTDVTTYRNRGVTAQQITGESLILNFYHQVQRLPLTGEYIPALKMLTDAAKVGTRGNASKLEYQVFDTEGADYAFQGVASVSMKRADTSNAGVGGINFVFTDDGNAKSIENTFAA